MGEAACRGPRERHSPGPNLALNGPADRRTDGRTPDRFIDPAPHIRQAVSIKNTRDYNVPCDM